MQPAVGLGINNPQQATLTDYREYLMHVHIGRRQRVTLPPVSTLTKSGRTCPVDFGGKTCFLPHRCNNTISLRNATVARECTLGMKVQSL